MQVATKVILNHADIFTAFKNYIANQMNVDPDDICNFRIDYDPNSYKNTTAIVELAHKEVVNGL